MRPYSQSTPSARIERWTPYLLVLAGLLLASVASAGSAGTWSPVDADPYSPGGGFFRATAYDTLRHQMLFFQDGTVYALSLDSPASWAPLAVTGTAPTATLGQSMVYDAAHDRMLLFGGQLPNGTLTDDLYALSLGPGAAWSLISPAGAKPAARGYHTAIYDTANRRMIVCGGEASPTFFNDVWRSRWTARRRGSR